MTDIPVVPVQEPDQRTFTVEPLTTPVVSPWWATWTITEIPGEAIGWLVAQDWQIVSIRYDESTVPPTPYYALTRQSLQSAQILQTLLGEYTFAYNTAMGLNEARYNDVVESWTEMLETSQVHFVAQITEQNAHALVFLGNLDTHMSAVDALIDANQTEIVEDALTASAALVAMDGKLTDLENNASDNATTISNLLKDQGTYLGTFLEDFSGKLAELDSSYRDHLGLMETLLSGADLDVDEFVLVQDAKLLELSNAYDALGTTLGLLLTDAGTRLLDITTEINTLLTALGTDYNDVDTGINNILGSCDTAFESYSGDYDEVVGLLVGDYDSHMGLATGFLTDLGATELARINEAFNASLATQLQQLTDRGVYSSAVGVDITARNTRDRDEQVAALNDRLAREKLENQHKLYGQQSAMRAATLAGYDRSHSVEQEVLRYKVAQVTALFQILQAVRDRTFGVRTTLYGLQDGNMRLNIEIRSTLYEAGQSIKRLLIEEAARIQQLRQGLTQWTVTQRDKLLEQVQQTALQLLTGIDKQHTTKQEVSRVAMAERDLLLGQLQEALKGFLAGKERYAAATMQTASTLAEHKHRVILEKMNEYAARLEGLRGQHADNMKLMAYQLDERNKLLVGLYGFVERREDVGPEFKDLAQLAVGLGDSGGGWITP